MSITTAALESPVLNVWNESGTNRGRIGDSAAVRLRSLRYMAPSTTLHTRSGGIRDRGGLSRPYRALFGSQTGFRRESRAHALWKMGMLGARPQADHHCVLAIGCGCSDGWAIETNSVARSNQMPSGVGIEKRKGTTTRVPTIGASQTSASRKVTRNLIAGRSGT